MRVGNIHFSLASSLMSLGGDNGTQGGLQPLQRKHPDNDTFTTDYRYPGRSMH